MPVEAGAEETQWRRSEVPENSLKGPNAGSAPIKETRDPLGEDSATIGIKAPSCPIPGPVLEATEWLNSTMRCSFTGAPGNAVLHVLKESNGRRGEKNINLFLASNAGQRDEVAPWVPHGIGVTALRDELESCVWQPHVIHDPLIATPHLLHVSHKYTTSQRV